MEIFANECLSEVSTTPPIKENNFEVVSALYCIPKDLNFAYFLFLGVGKLILAGLSSCWFH
jgi:hypothetical protein